MGNLNMIIKSKIALFILTFIVGFFFFTLQDVDAVDIPIVALIITENYSGYICSGNSIGCSALSSIYRVERRGEDLYVCSSGSFGSCTPLHTIYKTTQYDKDTKYICPANSIGSCSAFNVLYKVSQYDKDTHFVCPGNSIGGCSVFNVLYKVSKYDKDTHFVCPGSTIGKCSVFNVLYKFKRDTSLSPSGAIDDYFNLLEQQRKVEQEKIKQLKEEEKRIQEWYQTELNKIAELEKLAQNSCPVNSIPVGDKCQCNNGYSVYNNQCILSINYCRLTYGNNSFSKVINGVTYCDCSTGYTWNSGQTGCTKIEQNPQPSFSETSVTTQGFGSQELKTISPESDGQLESVVKGATIEEGEPASFDQGNNDVLEAVTEKENTTEVREEKTTKEESQKGVIGRIFNTVKNFFSKIFRK